MLLVKLIEVGNPAKTYRASHFRDCLGSLTNFDGKGSLQEHLEKTLRIDYDTGKYVYWPSGVVGKGKRVFIGDDTYRTAGDLSKVTGGLGKDMQTCLESK